MSKLYGVIFVTGGKVYCFKSDFSIDMDQNVIVLTEKGQQYGKVVLEYTDKDRLKKIKEYKEVLRIATEDDYNNHLKNLRDAESALKKCREIKDKLDLDMKIIAASYNFDRSQLIFNFLADERIDFRELARKLAAVYRTRIELRQIGARDKAKEIGGIGLCGQKLCCSNFLNSIDTVSINMAKNQNLALNPSKINGQCNRLLCCLSYEDDAYICARKKLPEIGNKVKTAAGVGVVTDLDILNNKYTVTVKDEKVVIDNNENSKK